MSKELKIEIYQQDWIPGFAAFRDDGSVKAEGKAHVVLNLGSFISAIKEGDLDRSDLPYFVAETLMHEVIHALEEWAGVEFNEEKVHGLIDKYSEKYGET